MTYYGDTHTFTNQTNSADITIKAGKNETLVIESPTFTGTVGLSIGTDEQVIYNDSGSLTGSSGFKYNGTDLTITNGSVIPSKVQASNGTESLPSYTFASELNTGLYRPSSGIAAISAAGTKIIEYNGGTNTSRVAIGGSSTESTNYLQGASALVFGNGVFQIGPPNARVGRIPMIVKNTVAFVANNLPVHMSFHNSAGSEVGSIYQVSASGIQYLSSSDRRLKDDIVPIENPLGLLTSLKPRSFLWKCMNPMCDICPTGDFCPDCVPDIGFIADEFQETMKDIAPNCVQGLGDSYKSIDKSVVIPLLVASVQELLKKIELLEARVGAA